MIYTSTAGKTYELSCFEFYNKRFFCLGNLVGDNEICEFISSYNFKYLLINDGYGKSTFRSNKLTANPALILKDPSYNEKFKNENNIILEKMCKILYIFEVPDTEIEHLIGSSS